jgi:hypothetical protein
MEQAIGIQSVKLPEKIDVKDLSKAVGRYLIVWRKDAKQVAKVLAVGESDFTFELLTGSDKGKKIKSKMLAKTIKLYDDDNLVLAMAE